MASGSRNIKIIIAYDGTDFCGWQRQKQGRTIQEEIERLLSLMTKNKITLHGAGRTDAGVHAKAMTANFTTGSTISCQNFLRGLNAMLPKAIRILHIEDINPGFHSRFSALAKQYQYVVYTGEIQPPWLRLYSLHVTSALNLRTINNCLKLIEGSHDFSSFENSGSRDKSYPSWRSGTRTILRTELIQKSPVEVIIEFTGDGFLRNMVRNLVGTFLEAGKGKLSSGEFAKILEAKDRTMAGPTAPAHGLFLTRVFYDQASSDEFFCLGN